MRAFVFWTRPSGPILGTGRGCAIITREYKSKETLIRYGVTPMLRPGDVVNVHIYNNWDRRYADPDRKVRIHA